MTTDDSGTFESDDMIQLVGYDMSKAAAQQVYEQTSIGPEDVSVVELHDCFAQNELLTYEALGLCPEGGASKFINDALGRLSEKKTGNVSLNSPTINCPPLILGTLPSLV